MINVVKTFPMVSKTLTGGSLERAPSLTTKNPSLLFEPLLFLF